MRPGQMTGVQVTKIMYFADIHFPDVANGPGIRVSVFVSGCTHKCPGCFNQEAWDFRYGQPFTDATIRQVLDMCDDPADGLTILGGEPFHPRNQAEVLKLARAYKEHYPQKNLWCYTGYTLEEILEGSFGVPALDELRADALPVTNELLRHIDVLVDGRFVEALKDIRLKFRGSSNQRLIDLSKTLSTGQIHIID